MSEREGETSSPYDVVTARLILRRFPRDDLEAIVEGRRLDGWAEDYPTDGDIGIAGMLHRSLASSTAAADDDTDADAGGTARWGHWQVVERESGLAIGGIGIKAPPESGTVEIGYGLAASRRGRGYATEAVRAVVAFALADGAVTAVRAEADHDNVASQRVLEKAGFRCVENADLLRYRFDDPS